MVSITTAAANMAHNPIREFLFALFNFLKLEEKRVCKNTQIMDMHASQQLQNQ